MEAQKAAASPSPLVWVVPIVLSVLSFAGILVWVLVPRVPDSGIDLAYRLPSSGVDRQDLETVARRRLDSLGINGSSFRIDQDQLILRLPGATPDTSARAKRLFGARGLLELRPVATVPLQEKFNRDQVVPEGYESIANPERARGGEYEAYGDRILVQKKSVIEGRRFIGAEAREERAPVGSRWVTTFELDAEGAKLFDAAAEELYNRRPCGLLAILLDGVLQSVPAVRSPAFHGKGQISGSKGEEEAKDLAVLLRTGALPVKLGEPESERPFGPRK